MPDRPLPDRTTLALYLTRGHNRDELSEIGLREIGADVAETPGYVFANCFLAERVDLGQSGLVEDVLV